jgi:hypothetical protein
VNTEQAVTYMQALSASLTINVVIPLLILLALLGFAWAMLSRAQRKDGFNVEDMFRDETGKVTASRVIAFFAFAVSSWWIAVGRLSGKTEDQAFFYYLAAWSGALVFIKFAERWDGSLPFGKGPQP